MGIQALKIAVKERGVVRGLWLWCENNIRLIFFFRVDQKLFMNSLYLEFTGRKRRRGRCFLRSIPLNQQWACVLFNWPGRHGREHKWCGWDEKLANGQRSRSSCTLWRHSSWLCWCQLELCANSIVGWNSQGCVKGAPNLAPEKPGLAMELDVYEFIHHTLYCTTYLYTIHV